ncbi:MFS transporter [Paractinoplanes lichenicola]|uniref:MFS transporter n=1 Tax=Paractinoplanes lichenicola TaxID=2802976 RepID=A0ABS1W1E5_9ACTN|nr:MFS transporter [Actinoplanes lichenicola]MBL7260567.1 MFS transporter [Actinoplanes lichenicola]
MASEVRNDMRLKPYRDTLALPGIKSLLAVTTLARIPIAAGAVVLTLHVVTDLGRGYGAAGLIGAAFTIGGSVGAPMMGRLIDRRGLRPVLVLTTVAEVIFWSTAQAVPYWALLVMALFGGFLALPAFSVARQSISALTPEAQRLPAFALDSITTELSFMAGPALGVLVATTAGGRWAMLMLAAGILASGVGLWLLNPPVRAAHEAPITAGERVPRRSWLGPRFVAILLVTMAATLVLSGTDVALVAVLRDNGELGWSGLVMSMWAFYSLLGGFAYGTMQRSFPPVVILAPLAVATMLVSLGGAHWWLIALLLIPAGALCAPLITSTADAISRMIPAAARGEAMGLHNSALTVGVALGGPLAGVAADTLSPPWGFVTVGGAGVLIALLVLPTELRRRRQSPPATAPEPTLTTGKSGPTTEPALAASILPAADSPNETPADRTPRQHTPHNDTLSARRP